MILSKKIRLKPTKEQEKQLIKSAGTARFIYNWTLDRQETNFKAGGKFISDNDLRKELTKLKKTQFGWLSEVSNDVAKQAVKDACDAYKRFFKKLAKKPKFKSRKKSKLSFYNDNVKLIFKQNKVLLTKIGWVKCNEPLLNQKFTNPRISFDGKYWYFSVGVEVKKPAVKLTNEIIGIDLGIKDLAVVSNGLVFKNINKTKTVKKLKTKLKRLQKQVSRKYKVGGSYQKTANIVKLEKQIRLLHRRLKNQRENQRHQITALLVKTKPAKIVVEDLDVKKMMKNKHLAEQIAEQSFFEFVRILQYKCEFYGIEFVKADRYFKSSQICSSCGVETGKKPLHVRSFVCPHCGTKHDRDLNAAINLANYK